MATSSTRYHHHHGRWNAAAPQSAAPVDATDARKRHIHSDEMRLHAGRSRRPCRHAARQAWTFRFPKVHASEISKECLETLGFRPAGGHLRFAARARSE